MAETEPAKQIDRQTPVGKTAAESPLHGSNTQWQQCITNYKLDRMEETPRTGLGPEI